MKENKELKNGVELLLSLALSLDLLEQYKANRLMKRKINLAKEEIEKSITAHYSKVYSNDEEFVQNSLNLKENAIKIISKYNEADCVLAISFLEWFNDNIEVAREKGEVFFSKILS